MRFGSRVAALVCLMLFPFDGTVHAQEKSEPPTDWVDAVTGHRVIRLSGPGGGSSLYFHQNTYTPEGDKIIFNSKGAIVAVDISKLGISLRKPRSCFREPMPWPWRLNRETFISPKVARGAAARAAFSP